MLRRQRHQRRVCPPCDCGDHRPVVALVRGRRVHREAVHLHARARRRHTPARCRRQRAHRAQHRGVPRAPHCAGDCGVCLCVRGWCHAGRRRCLGARAGHATPPFKPRGVSVTCISDGGVHGVGARCACNCVDSHPHNSTSSMHVALLLLSFQLHQSAPFVRGSDHNTRPRDSATYPHTPVCHTHKHVLAHQLLAVALACLDVAQARQAAADALASPLPAAGAQHRSSGRRRSGV
jgi:hypothetical protein